MKRGLLVALAACNAKAPPPEPAPTPAPAPAPAPACDVVIDRVESIWLATELATNDDAVIATARADAKDALDELRSKCAHWSALYRTCIARSATDKAGIQRCDRDALVAGGFDLGGPPCDAVIAHVVEVENIGASHRDQALAVLGPACGAMTRAMKECSLAAADHAGLAACAEKHTESFR